MAFPGLIQTMKLGLTPDFDVYDSATWSIGVAAQRRVATPRRDGVGRVVDVPDFTREQWQGDRPGLDSVDRHRRHADPADDCGLRSRLGRATSTRILPRRQRR